MAGVASTLGFSQSQASGFADSLVRFMRGQGGQAITIAVTFGGIGGAIATMLGYTKYAIAVGVLTGIAAVLLFFLIPNHPSPYEGKWTMNALETAYQAGVPPRQSTEEITEESRGLKIKRISILEGGQRERQTYQVHTDSAPFQSELTGDSVVTTRDGDTLTSVYSRNGQAVVREIMTLSADHKRMTVTTSKRAPSGELVDNVTVYDRE